MWCNLITLAVHPLIAHFLIIHNGMQLQGVAAASLLSNGLTYTLMRINFSRQVDMNESNISP